MQSCRRAVVSGISLALPLLLLLALVQVHAKGPTAEEQLKQAGLVELVTLDPSIILDIRYATDNNFSGQVVYPSARCFLLESVARKVVAVQQELRAKGLGLKVFDGYRPFSVQKKFWEIVPDSRFVAEAVEKDGKPFKGSKHNRGAAVDLTLVDAQGQELPMPTPFDDFTEKASPSYTGSDPQARANMLLLQETMVRHGFKPISTEWWHFDSEGWESCPLLDVPLP